MGVHACEPLLIRRPLPHRSGNGNGIVMRGLVMVWRGKCQAWKDKHDITVPPSDPKNTSAPISSPCRLQLVFLMGNYIYRFFISVWFFFRLSTSSATMLLLRLWNPSMIRHTRTSKATETVAQISNQLLSTKKTVWSQNVDLQHYTPFRLFR